jgi:hypothetical protein
MPLVAVTFLYVVILLFFVLEEFVRRDAPYHLKIESQCADPDVQAFRLLNVMKISDFANSSTLAKDIFWDFIFYARCFAVIGTVCLLIYACLSPAYLYLFLVRTVSL